MSPTSASRPAGCKVGRVSVNAPYVFVRLAVGKLRKPRFRVPGREFGAIESGYRRVLAICQWIRGNIKYQIGTSSPLTTATGSAFSAAHNVPITSSAS